MIRSMTSRSPKSNMKTYKIEITVVEGCDEFWESIQGTSGCDEVLEAIKTALAYHGFSEPGCKVVLRQYRDDENFP